MAKRRRNIEGPVQDAIEQMALTTTWTAAQIERELKKRPEFQGGRLPILRTIQTIVKECRPPDPSGSWSVAEAEEDEAPYILDVLADVADLTCGNKTSLTRAEVAWINRIHVCQTGLSPWDVYLVARVYMLRESRKEMTEDLDIYLAFHPWASDKDYQRYTQAVDEDIIPEARGLRLHFPKSKEGGKQ